MKLASTIGFLFGTRNRAGGLARIDPDFSVANADSAGYVSPDFGLRRARSTRRLGQFAEESFNRADVPLVDRQAIEI